jgi:hypothetical protein
MLREACLGIDWRFCGLLRWVRFGKGFMYVILIPSLFNWQLFLVTAPQARDRHMVPVNCSTKDRPKNNNNSEIPLFSPAGVAYA